MVTLPWTFTALNFISVIAFDLANASIQDHTKASPRHVYDAIQNRAMDLMVPKNRSPSLTVFVKDYDVTKSTTEQWRSFKNNYFSITFSNYLNKECTYFQRKRTPCVSLLELVIQNKVYRQTDFGIPFYSLLSFFRKFIKSY